jgi:pimeloyl-ACP methyl ester carboxylesterase
MLTGLRRRDTGRVLVIAVVLLICTTASSGCAAHARPLVADRFVSLNGHSLRLHFANAQASVVCPLLIYATGDGGMRRKDLDTYRHLVSWGYPIVGFDARDYVKHLGRGSDATTPERLAADYARIIDSARETLGIDARRPVVLIGVSRGAGLSVIAAGELRQVIAGVVAVALTQEEEYVRWYRRLRVLREPRRAVMVDVYEYLAQLGDLPLATIQSTRDQYLPAAKARALFGPDTQRRWLQPIDAQNHNFRGARSRMYSAIQAALIWVTAPPKLPD